MLFIVLFTRTLYEILHNLKQQQRAAVSVELIDADREACRMSIIDRSFDRLRANRVTFVSSAACC